MFKTFMERQNADLTEDPFLQDKPGRWFLDWPLYIVLVISAYLHFFQLQSTEFDFDQASLFQMAHDTVAHGLIPLSSNMASINILNPPFFIYTLLPAAALSNNPLGGAITVSLFSTATAVLVYLFTRRYFGLLPALVAALLSTTAYNPLKYGRGIWQPDILPFFMICFLFAIFRGAVERKKGWFVPAVVLIAIMYQLHASSIVALVGLLILTLLLAPTTIRWWEYVVAGVGFILLLLPYGLLELTNHFADLNGIIAFSQLPAHNDLNALSFYQNLFSPFTEFHPHWMSLLGLVIQILFFMGLVAALVRLVRPRWSSEIFAEEQATSSNRWLRFWNALRFNPERVAFLLLLAWQVIPFANLIHHSVGLHMQYFLLFLPGPFILAGLPLGEFVSLVERFRPKLALVAHVGTVLLIVLLVGGQLASSTAYLLKMGEGHYNDRTLQNIPYVNDLNSLWNAAHQADQLAQAKHISRVFITMDYHVQPSMTYLGETLQTPTTIVGYNSCLILPAQEAGPAVYLVGPYADDLDSMLHRFASATLVAQPPRLGGKPFRLYIVTPRAVGAAPPVENFTDPLQLSENTIQLLPGQAGKLEVTRLSMQHTAPAAARTLYNYQLSLTPRQGAKALTTTCVTTSMRRHDQLLAAFQVPAHTTLAPLQTVGGMAFKTGPDLHHLGPIQLTSFNNRTISTAVLRTSTGSETVQLTAK